MPEGVLKGSYRATGIWEYTNYHNMIMGYILGFLVGHMGI